MHLIPRIVENRATADSGKAVLEGKSVLLVEEEVFIATNIENCLLDAGAAHVEIANSSTSAKRALDKTKYDAAVVDLRLANGIANSLIERLYEGRILFVITTGYDIEQCRPAFDKFVLRQNLI
ncbi:response regulator [Methylocapsa palsarum]|uniref:Response regulator receiver domain-containing protein n=1 Tax=Methylocapsa palsarum TaxID=1612308 RepID=A0A1I4ASC2_9HYPH|nr:response regulator [Methylocapsa palsarum]SFK59284.1 Response regulator receiver domain-containing protein [Methylocapsa palsarum]